MPARRTGDLRVLRVIGLGLAVAILLDATLVRVVATPAVLQLTGRANWWFPRAAGRAVPAFLAEIEPTVTGPREIGPEQLQATPYPIPQGKEAQ